MPHRRRPAYSGKGPSMPADPTPNPPPPAGKPRRRPAPGVGGNLIWVVLIVLLLSWLFHQSAGPGGSVEWGEFYTLLKKDEDAAKAGQPLNLKRVVFYGTERIAGEVNDLSRVPEELSAKM